MQRILVSGGSGFIGSPLISFLESQGYRVVQLVRGSNPISDHSIIWDPEAHIAPEGSFDGFDIVIHLAGEPLTLNRWSKEKRELILKSRVEGTMFLSHLLSTVRNPPKLFISASAVGFYGDRGDALLTEDSTAGTGFLSHVCGAWEEASFSLKNRGVRTAQARFGMVIGPNGGALEKMLPAYRLGLGGKLGDGLQWISWIDLEDLIKAIQHIIHEESIEGAVNIVSPNPVRQEEFAEELAGLLHRPHFMRVPAWLLRFLLGSVADEFVLSSTRVKPSKLLASNFQFQYPDLLGSFKKAIKN